MAFCKRDVYLTLRSNAYVTLEIHISVKLGDLTLFVKIAVDFVVGHAVVCQV